MEMQTGELTGQDKVDRIRQIYAQLKIRFTDFREAQDRGYRYVVGDQISREMRKKLKEQKRPAIVWNLIQPVATAIAGYLLTNKTRLKAVPVRQGDEQKSDLHTTLVSDFAIGTEGYEEIAKAALDAAIAKVGWVNQYWSTKDNPEGEWKCESVDPYMVMWDDSGRRVNQTDWRYMTVSAFYSAEEILNMYAPFISPEDAQALMAEAEKAEGIRRRPGMPVSWIQRIWRSALDYMGQKRELTATDDYGDPANGIYRVIEFHDRRATSQVHEFAPGIQSKIEQEALFITAVVPYLLKDRVLFESPYPIQNRGFQVKPIFALDYHRDLLQSQSLLDSLLDPQDSFNQRRMSWLEWIMDAVNPDYTMPEGAVDPSNETEWMSKERGVLKRYKPIGGMKPEREQPLAQAANLESFAREDQSLIQQISGVSPNLMGFSETAKETGVLYAQRVKVGMIMLQPYMNHVERAMRAIFSYADRGLQIYMTFPRKVRLLNNESDPSWLQLNMPSMMGVQNDITQGEYDFVVDTAKLGSTAKQAQFQEMLELMKVIPPQLMYWPEVFELWDSPSAQKFKKYAEMVLGMQLSQVVNQQQMQNAQSALQLTMGLGQLGGGGMGQMGAPGQGGGNGQKQIGSGKKKSRKLKITKRDDTGRVSEVTEETGEQD